MKVNASRSKPRFQPVAITVTLQSQKELDSLTAIAARSRKIPEAMFHSERYSEAVQSLRDRGISPSDVTNVLKDLFKVLLAAGGQP